MNESARAQVKHDASTSRRRVQREAEEEDCRKKQRNKESRQPPPPTTTALPSLACLAWRPRTAIDKQSSVYHLFLRAIDRSDVRRHRSCAHTPLSNCIALQPINPLLSDSGVILAAIRSVACCDKDGSHSLHLYSRSGESCSPTATRSRSLMNLSVVFA